MESSDNTNGQKKPQSIKDIVWKSDFINFVEEDLNLLKHYFSNFVFYMTQIKAIVDKKKEANNNIKLENLSDECLYDQFAHSDQLNERTEFLKFFAG